MGLEQLTFNLIRRALTNSQYKARDESVGGPYQKSRGSIDFIIDLFVVAVVNFDIFLTEFSRMSWAPLYHVGIGTSKGIIWEKTILIGVRSLVVCTEGAIFSVDLELCFVERIRALPIWNIWAMKINCLVRTIRRLDLRAQFVSRRCNRFISGLIYWTLAGALFGSAAACQAESH